MDITEQLRQMEGVPFGHEALIRMLGKYRSPNDKIVRLIRGNDITSIKRGLYVVGTKHRKEPVSRELISNLLYGPSYVSLEYALWWHGMIPEAVHVLTAVSMKRAQWFETSFGNFSYTQSFVPFYAIGIHSISHKNGISFLMAGREKALCDHIIFTANLKAFTTTSMEAYLLHSLRIDPEVLPELSPDVIAACAHAGRKQRQLKALYNLIQKYHGSD